jgi:hypothetical protein
MSLQPIGLSSTNPEHSELETFSEKLIVVRVAARGGS